MNAVQIYIGIVHEDKKIAFSYQIQSLSGDIIASVNRFGLHLTIGAF